MKSFLSYLSEAKNTHLEHLEDSIFLNGAAGIDMAIGLINDVIKTLAGDSKGSAYVSVKWDGAPAIICGQDPKTNQFFIATKSLFNKTPKVNYSHTDIDTNHGGSGVAAKLHAAFDALKDAGIKGIIQGDLMFTPGDVKTQNIDGKSHLTFQPNTIMYAVRVDSELGKKISRAKVGVVFHTQYSGSDLKSLSASFNPDISGLKTGGKVWISSATFKDASGTANLTAGEMETMKKMLTTISGFKSNSSLTALLNNISSDANLEDVVSRYFNSKIRSGVDLGTTPDLIKFIHDDPKTNKKYIQVVRNNASAFKQVFILHKQIALAKNFIISKMNKVKTVGSFYPTSNGYKVANPEGFVAVSSSGVFKLVDRLEFSQQNFNAIKNWT